jgi:uncharacterized protein (TIGR01777 family)
VSASAVGYYGDRDEETLDERAGAGRGFLADVGEAWESAPAPLEAAGARVVRARIGIVLTPRGTALHKMLLPYRFGAGGPLGSGRQWMSWIALDDAIGALHHAIVREDVRGAVNVVAPEAVRNATLARTLGRVIGRPALLPVPAFALRLVVGRDFANEALLSSQRVTPAVLEATGYAFRFPRLEGALRHVLGRTREPERE